MRARVARTAILATACALALSSCGGGDDRLALFREPEPPVGSALLPDLMPRPQYNVLVDKIDGRWHIRFTTVIVNVGKSDFLLRATRDELESPWRAEQLVPHSTSGVASVPLDAGLAWGGDGHDHWHIVRVATVWLVPLGTDGEPVNDDRSLTDTKIGFCFYDHTRVLETGPEEGVYSAHTCGHEDDTLLGMGLSPGWNDTYLMSLPGQYIDIHDLPEGKYRLWTEVDENGWFREETRENNRTWIDLDVTMTPNGPAAPTIGTGPSPTDQR